MALEFHLPWPPSVNAAWRSVVINGRSRVLLSREGREYRVRASEAVLVQRVPRSKLTGKLAIRVVACPPDRRRRDLSNLWKVFEDALTHCNVIRDDSDFDDMHIVRGPVVPGGQLELSLSEIPGEPTESGRLFESGPP